MRIITRYVIRAHAGPFFFAFTAVTGLLFLNAVIQRMSNLVGKGLSWTVIGEFMLLSLPHTIALTLPMAILVATLYTFSELTASNEITAMAAGGIRPLRVMAPMLVVGLMFVGVMLYFNDQLLPRANHRLRNLLIDVSTKSPTLELEEHIVNRLETAAQTGNVYLEFGEIDRATNELTDVVIYDLTDPLSYRTTYAERATMMFNEDRTDLYLTLYDGVLYEVSGNREGGFSRSRFDKEIQPLRGVGNVMQRQAGGIARGDREMTIRQLRAESDEHAADTERVKTSNHRRSIAAIELALALPIPGDASGDTAAAGARLPALRTAGFMADMDDMTRGVAQNARQNLSQIRAHERRIDVLSVEVHKKWAIAVASIVFVLLGAPLAMRFPRGGPGMVIAVSIAIFTIYWAGLIGGENLADDNKVSPIVAMWAPDILFTIFGVGLVMRMGRQAATSRGGGWEDILRPISRSAKGLWAGKRAVG
ncbi:MAG: LptF/LptG family permease [Longimicrobiales bacterium]